METMQVAKRLGVTAGTLRLWERRGLISPIPRDPRGWRIWSARNVDACRRLLLKLHGSQGR